MKSLATSSTSWSGRRSLVCPGPCSVGRGTKAVLSPHTPAATRSGGLRRRLVSVRTAADGLNRPRVFALEWGDPPFNGGHWIPEMIEIAGAEALLACPGTPSVRMTWEHIGAAQPEVVVFMPCGYGLEAATDEARRTLLQRPELAGATAILAVDANAYFSRPGPRLVDGVEILAAALHPGRLAPPPAGTAVRLRDEPDR